MEVSNGTGQNTDYRISGTGGSGSPDPGTGTGGFFRCKDYAKGELPAYSAHKCECPDGSFYVEFIVDHTKIVRWFASNPGRVELIAVDKEKGVYAVQTG